MADLKPVIDGRTNAGGWPAMFRSPPLRHALFALLAVLAAGSLGAALINLVDQGGDLQWQEARLLLAGLNPYALFLDGADIGALAGSPDTTEIVQLPSVLLLIVPLALLEHGAAQFVWLLLNLAAIAAFLGLSVRLFCPVRVSAGGFALLALILLASTPVRVTLTVSQQGLVAMAFLLAAVHFFERRRLVPAAILSALALLKYTLVLPFFALMLYRPRDSLLVAGAALAAHGALTVAAAAMAGTDPALMVRQSLQIAATISANGTFDFFSFFDWAAPRAGAALPVACSALVIAATAALARRPLDTRGVAIVAIVSIVIVYHRIYDAFVLILLVFHLLHLLRQPPRARGRPDWGRRLEIAGGVLILAYVFFIDRLVLQMLRWGALTYPQREAITAAAAAAIYAYLALLFLRGRAVGDDAAPEPGHPPETGSHRSSH